MMPPNAAPPPGWEPRAGARSSWGAGLTRKGTGPRPAPAVIHVCRAALGDER